jgi:hypothetical protein
VDSEGDIALHPEYAENFNSNIQKMLANAAEQAEAPVEATSTFVLGENGVE